MARMKAMALLCALLFICAPAFAGQRISNATVGIEVVMPDGWERMSAEEDSENLGRIDFASPAAERAIAQRSELPIIVFRKYPDEHFGVNPTFKILFRRLSPLGSTVELFDAVARFMREAFSDGRLVEGPTETRVGGRRALHARFTYTIMVDGEGFATVSEMWLVQRGAHVFTIGAGYGPDEPAGTRDEIRAAVESIVIAPGR